MRVSIHVSDGKYIVAAGVAELGVGESWTDALGVAADQVIDSLDHKSAAVICLEAERTRRRGPVSAPASA